MESQEYRDPPEAWADVPGWVGIYQVSNLGRVRSGTRWVIRPDGTPMIIPGKVHTPKLAGGAGYKSCQRLYVTFSRCHPIRLTKTILVNRLVALAFIPNPEDKPEVNHIDGNPLNNCVWNLEWNTKDENMNHAERLGLIGRHWSNIRHIVRCVELGITAIGVGRMCELLNERGYHVNFPSILRCVQGKHRHHRGLTFRSIATSELNGIKPELFFSKLGIPT